MPRAKKTSPLPYNPARQPRARALRRAGILHETLLWQQLKNRQLNRLDFNRQKIIGNYIVDLYCPSRRTVIELDGSSHEDKAEYDHRREQYLTSLGLEIIRISVTDILNNLEGVIEFLQQHQKLKTPNP